MPVFDFNNAPEGEKAICTYETFKSNENKPSAEKPIMLLDNSTKQWNHHSLGTFTNPVKKTTFEFDSEDGTLVSDILKIDSRLWHFTSGLEKTISRSSCQERTQQRAMLCIK